MKKLFELFEEMGFMNAEGFFRQGSLTDDTYPPEFFTFWNVETENDSFYDNEEHRFIEYVQVGFYTTDATRIYSVMDDFIERAKAKGFAVDGRAKDADADKPNYFGRVCFIRIINNL